MEQTSNYRQASLATMPCAVTSSSCRQRNGWLVSGGYLPWESLPGASCTATGWKWLKETNFCDVSYYDMGFFCRNQFVPEHLRGFYGRQPEAVRVAVVVASPSSVTLYERSTAELLQAGTGGGQSLTRALCTSTGVLRGRGLVTFYCDYRCRAVKQVGCMQAWMEYFNVWVSRPTIMKEYPIHRASQFAGQVGIWMVWLWTAITMAGASHTAHLHAKKQKKAPSLPASSKL